MKIDLAVNQPVQIGVGKFADGVRPHANRRLGGVGGRTRNSAEAQNVRSSSLRGSLRRVVQHGDHVHRRELRQFAQRLIHEHAAAMHRRADGIRRNEQHAQSRDRERSGPRRNRSRK